MTFKATRRNFLKNGGRASLALPFLASLEPGRAHAQSAPKRIIFVYMPQNETEDFKPTGSGASFSLAGTYLEPLAPFKNRMLVLHNMKGRQGHYAGHSECMTGYPADGFVWRPSGGPSIDQMMAERLKGQTRVDSLGVTVVAKRTAVRDDAVLAWTKDALAIPAFDQPIDAFEKVFGAGGGQAAAPVDDQGRRIALKKSLLGSLMTDYQRINARLGVEDRRLLDAHLTLLRDLEKKLVAPPPPVSCNGGTPPPGERPEDYYEGDRPTNTGHYIDIITTAMGCDITRIATLAMGNSQDGKHFTWVGVDENFHEIAHVNVGTQAKARDYHFKVRKWQAEQFARLCRQLDAIPQPGGRTLLDQTAVVWLSELGYYETTWGGNTHSRANVPAVIVGSCGGAFKTGQYLDLQQRDQCDLLLTLVNAMGFGDIKSVGKFSKGPLTQLLT